MFSSWVIWFRPRLRWVQIVALGCQLWRALGQTSTPSSHSAPTCRMSRTWSPCSTGSASQGISARSQCLSCLLRSSWHSSSALHCYCTWLGKCWDKDKERLKVIHDRRWQGNSCWSQESAVPQCWCWHSKKKMSQKQHLARKQYFHLTDKSKSSFNDGGANTSQ